MNKRSTHTHEQTHTHAHAQAHAHSRMHTHEHTRIRTHTHTRTNTHTDTHTHTQPGKVSVLTTVEIFLLPRVARYKHAGLPSVSSMGLRIPGFLDLLFLLLRFATPDT